MKTVFAQMFRTTLHLKILHDVFTDENNFKDEEQLDYTIYMQNEKKLRETLNNLDFDKQLYSRKGRQMILADFYEYIFFGRGYYSIQSIGDRRDFIKAILHFVNMLMCYEMMTVSSNVRQKYLDKLANKVISPEHEEFFEELKSFEESVGLKRDESKAPSHLNDYFDSLLPKTAGGLWHELLVYIFLLRNNFGYVVPLLLNQRLLSRDTHIVPPDFLIITFDKRIYGIEVGMKKEIQSGSFSLQTAIPTATIDTINSRTSDRCPSCKRWIPFCDYVVDNYSNLEKEITKAEIRCIDKCNLYPKEDIASGACPYTKYSRNRAKTLEHARHKYADGLHYHYQCVLEKLPANTKKNVINAVDAVALKTHFPYYSGLEELMK